MLYRVLNPRRAMEALRLPAYRWFVLGRICGASTGQLRQVAQGWLVYSMTGLALALAWVGAAQALVMLVLSPYGGVIADRFEKRYVIFWARMVLLGTSCLMAILFYSGRLQLWHIVVLGMVNGVAFSFMDPAQNVIVSELVNRETLLNAISLNAVFEGLAGIAGAVVAGLLVAWAGAGAVYMAMAVMFCLAAYTVLQLPRGLAAGGGGMSVHAGVWQGMRYLWSNRALRTLLGLSLVALMLTQPVGAFLPAYSRSVLGLGAAGLGLLTAAIAAGSLVSALVVASSGDPRRRGGLLLAAGIAAAVCVLMMLAIPVVGSALVFITLAAGFSKMWDVLAGTLMQSLSEPAYRARIFSASMVLMGIVSLATLPAGALADAVGVSTVFAVLALFVLAVNIAVAVLRPDVRRLR